MIVIKRLILIASIITFIIGLSSITIVNATNVEELNQKIEEQKAIKNKVHDIAEIARDLNFAEDHSIITTAQKEWWAADARQQEYNKAIEEWKKKEAEYPDAAYIWNYLKEYGYSDYVAAGILGNIMVECGGQTLALQPTIWGDGFYGICQWGGYYPEVWNCSLEEQCKFLTDTIEKEIDIYGGSYDYESFLKIEDAEEIAYVFAYSYERCASWSYYMRQSCALDALDYFTN